MKKKYSGTGFRNVTIAFILVIVIVLANVGFNFYLVNKNKTTIAQMTEVINPYIEDLEKFNLMVTESKMYSTNWAYLKYSDADKDSLRLLHSKRYPALKADLEEKLTLLNKTEDKKNLQKVFKDFNELIKVEQEIMENLAANDDYEIPLKKLGSEELVEYEILPRTDSIMAQLSTIVKRNRKEALDMKEEIVASSNQVMTIMMLASVVLFLFVIFASVFISRAISKPVVKMKDIVQQLSRGELPDETIDVKDNVIGEMGSSVNTLTQSFTRTAVFAGEIGKGNLKVEYEKLSENDLLGNSLISMRDSLRAYSDDMENQVRDRTREVLEKGIKLEHAYKEIRDSINYAKRIQESILPADEMICKAFNNSFVFYRPKDIVCGDFYWFSHKGDEVVIAAIDCTGHGVPGALMTVIGNSLLNQIVNFSGVTDPAKILTQLDKKLLETFQQHGAVATNDGMDAAICRYKISKKEITFAGAKRPMYMFKNGELLEIKGNKSPIGSYQHEFDKLFSEHRMAMNTNDTIYLFSDGLQDQFGGEDGKKFMVKRFRDLLIDIQPLTMKDQAMVLEKELTTWQGGFEQTDDMLLIGIRF